MSSIGNIDVCIECILAFVFRQAIHVTEMSATVGRPTAAEDCVMFTSCGTSGDLNHAHGLRQLLRWAPEL